MSDQLDNYRNRLVYGGCTFSEAFASKFKELARVTHDDKFEVNIRNIDAKEIVFKLDNGQDVSLPKDTLQLLLLRFVNGTI